MAKMIKDSARLSCDVCGETIAFAKVIKRWADDSVAGDAQYNGMVRRCKCGSFDAEGNDIKKLVG